MNPDNEHLETVMTVPTAFEATALVAALEAEGIRARHVGDYVAGFEALAPAWVEIIVPASDLARAKAIIDDLRKRGAGVDWSKIDVEHMTKDDDPSAPADQPEL